ncbi:hypothetical protein ONS95_014366 [Cadophora gregata]|uniref:uncharacterized protein n=1 Tax=Cadophora gregata TaxID=51156 RepID=UPI0026DBDD86|nr:uncharacterized protein ONS95_014366 [Cadophora gregata]KAK0112625.1 hypothetical protein ONS95_014366 [Cadophora gregata]
MPTVFPKIPYRSRSRTLSRAGTMELPSSPPAQSMDSAKPAVTEEIQTPEPGAWLAKDIGKQSTHGARDDTRNAKISITSKSEAKDFFDKDLKHEDDGIDSVDSGVELNNDHLISPTTQEDSQPADSPKAFTVLQTSEDPFPSPPSKNTTESGSTLQSTQMTPIASSDDLIMKELESQSMMLPVTDTPEVLVDAQLSMGSFDQAVFHDPMGDLLWGRVSLVPEAPKSQQKLQAEFSTKHIHDPMADILWGRSPSSTNAPTLSQSLAKEALSDPMFDILWERTQRSRPAALHVPQSQQTVMSTLKTSGDPMFDILWERTNIAQSNGSRSRNYKQTVAVNPPTQFHDPMFDILWERTQRPSSNASEAQRTPHSAVFKPSKVFADPMFDILWERTRMAPSNAVATPRVQKKAVIQPSQQFPDPMFDILWERVQVPKSHATAGPKHEKSAARDISTVAVHDPMFDILWERSQVSQASQAVKALQVPVEQTSKESACDPMFDILWQRTPVPPASKALNIQKAPVPHLSQDAARDPMFDILWERTKVSATPKALNIQQTPIEYASKQIVHDPMFDVLWERTKVSPALSTLNFQRTLAPPTSWEVISDPMFDILWERSQVSRPPQAVKKQQTPVHETPKEIVRDPMFDILWERNTVSGAAKNQLTPVLEKSKDFINDPMFNILWQRTRSPLAGSRQALGRGQVGASQEISSDPMFNILWGRGQNSGSKSPKLVLDRKTPATAKIGPDPMFDVLWGRSELSQATLTESAQQKTRYAIEHIHDSMSDILWERIPSSQPAVYQNRDVSTSPYATDSNSKVLEYRQRPVKEPIHDPMSDSLWGRGHTSCSVHDFEVFNANAGLQGHQKSHEATEAQNQKTWSEQEAGEAVPRSHGGRLLETGSWPLATDRDLIIDHGEDNLSTSSVDEIHHVLSTENSFDQPASNYSIPSSPQKNDFEDNEMHHNPPFRHLEGEPWPLRDEHQISLNNNVSNEQVDHDESDGISEGEDNWSESDEEEAFELEQRIGSLRPHQTHCMSNDDEYLPRSASSIAAADSDDDLSFEEKYGVPRPSSPIRSLSRIENHLESTYTGPDASEFFDDDDESEDESSARQAYPEDLADQYFQRADTPLEIVPEHSQLTEFNDTYSSHRSSGIFVNIVDTVRSDIPVVRQVQLDHDQLRDAYELGSAGRPRAVSFEDEDSGFSPASVSYEPSMRVRAHTADTIPSFDSYAQSDSIPTTPSETSSSPFVDHPHDEPIIRDSGRERGMTETSQTTQDLALETPKADTFDPTLTNAYPSFMSPKPNYADLNEKYQNPSDIERMNAGYGSFGAQTGLEAHRTEISPIRDVGRNPFINDLDTQIPKMASNNPFKTSMGQNPPISGSFKAPTAESPFRTARSPARTPPPRLSISPQSSSSPSGLHGSTTPSPGLAKRPVPTGSPGSLFAKTRSVFESASPQGSPALTPSPITALSAIRHNFPPPPPPPRRSMGSRPSSLHISEPVRYSPTIEKEPEQVQTNAQEQHDAPREEEGEEEIVFMPRSLDGNNKPPSPVFIPARSDSVASLRKQEDDGNFVSKRASNPFLGGLSRFVGGIQSQGLDDSVHNPAREPLLKRGEEL